MEPYWIQEMILKQLKKTVEQSLSENPENENEEQSLNKNPEKQSIDGRNGGMANATT